MYDTVNNGVYRAGFATTQAAYENAVVPLFAMLDELEERLSTGRYLFGARLTAEPRIEQGIGDTARRDGGEDGSSDLAENVPFNETRDYVKKVLSNTTNYAALITGQPQSLKARMGMVSPRDAALPLPTEDLP